MASERAGILSEGSLYELISRGNKDVFFLSQKLGGPTVNPFETRYQRRPGFVSELRRIVPINAPDFGRSCEFEFDIAGDVFTDTTILVDLPTWLPRVEAVVNQTANTTILATGSGRAYGYSRGIGYFLFETVQLYQDKVLLQEFSGDALWASRQARGSLNSAWLDAALTGMTDLSGAAVVLARNATPGRLRLSLPMVGGQTGLPSLAMRKQTFRLRLVLRTLEELIECSDPAVSLPLAPWKEPSFTVTDASGGTYTIAPLSREQIGRPTILLETRHLYMDPQAREAIESTPFEIPYSVLNENNFTLSGKDYASANVAALQFPTVTRLLDAEHPASRLFWFLRTRDDLERGRRWATGSPDNPYYQTVSLIIAARDRETAWTHRVWKTLTHFAKEERDPGFELGEMNWDLGAIEGLRAPVARGPEGSINFSTAIRPTLQLTLKRPDTFATEVVEITAVVDSWAIYTIGEQRGLFKVST